MKQNILSKLMQFALIAAAMATSALAQENQLIDIVVAGQKINQSANKSQQKVDVINSNIITKLQQFKTVNKELDGLNVYNKQMTKQIANQLKELTQIDVSMAQVSIIERQISPLMARMISTLATFVSLDMPFLATERSQRLTGLNAMLERADIAVSEKFRRVLEAYQVEVDYGRTIEAYSGLLAVEGVERNVDFLRIGRVSLVYQTRDGQNLGMWQQSSQAWQPLSGEYRLSINKALRIARKQLAPDLITVPVTHNSAE